MLARLTGSSAVLLIAGSGALDQVLPRRLGLTCEAYGEPPDFCVAERDDAVILMALCDDAERIVPTWRIVDKAGNVYIRVDEVETIYAELRDRGAPIDHSIYDAPSGFREFDVQDPDDHDIAIGQPIDREQA